VLLLDEPTAGLDAETAERLLGDVLSSTGSRSVLLVSHRPEELAAFEDVLTLRR
jgi:ABC-type transport system involved in cytochrome bd biosynthesis fused ATPase/permease subunit